MRKIFLFLFAAVLSIGTAMAQTTHDFYAEGVTVSEGGWSINLAGSWNEQSFTVMLWQDNTQGFGTYAADAYTGYSASLGTKELTPTAEGYYMVDPMNPEGFVFQGTMTDGTDTYEVYLKGSTGAPATPETGELEAEIYPEISDGVWSAVAYADDYSWKLEVTIQDYYGYDTYEVSAVFEPDMLGNESSEITLFGTAMVYFDTQTGKEVFKAFELASEDGSVVIYPTLYVSSVFYMSNTVSSAVPSTWGEDYGIEGYSLIELREENYLWSLELHIPNFTGAGTYELATETYTHEVEIMGEMVTEEIKLYSTYNGEYPVMGEVNVTEENGLYTYECYLYAVGEGETEGMIIEVIVWEQSAVEYNISITDATIVEELKNNWEGGTVSDWSLTGEFEHEGNIYPVVLTIADDVDKSGASANLQIGLLVEGLGYVDGEATVAINGNTMTVIGQVEDMWEGNRFNLNISGSLPTCPTIRLNMSDNAVLLTATHNKNANVIVNRTLYANDGFYTICLPFSMPASVIGKAYQIKTITASGDGGVNVEFASTATIEAGQPYLIEPTHDVSGFTVENVTINNNTPSVVSASGAGVSIAMQGMYNRDGMTEGKYWVGNGGYLYNDNKYTNALCAYFNITTPSGIAPHMRVVAGENETTGVDNIATGAKVVKTIENGQLIIIRNGEKFNVQGIKL